MSEKKTIKLASKAVTETKEGRYGPVRSVKLIGQDGSHIFSKDFVLTKAGVEFDALREGSIYEIEFEMSGKWKNISKIEEIFLVDSDDIENPDEPDSYLDPTEPPSNKDNAFSLDKALQSSVQEAVGIYAGVLSELSARFPGSDVEHISGQIAQNIIEVLVTEAGHNFRTRMIAYDKHLRKERY